MKRIIIISFLISILTGNILCQVQEKEIYEVLNQLVEINNVKVLSKTAKTLNIENPFQHEFIDWCINTGEERIELSQIDSVFIIEQVNSIEEIKWDKKKIDKDIRIKKKSIDYFSIPLFLNHSKDFFIILHEEYAGPMEAEGKYELYKKTNNGWKLINVITIWMS